MGGKTFAVTINTELEKLSEISDAVHGFLAAAGVSPEPAYKLELAMEEMVTNVIKYGYDVQTPENTVRISLALTDAEVVLTIEDGGHEFNPLEAAPPDTGKTLATRPIGGVGIHLTRNMTDAMDYHRTHDRNILVIKVKR